jgi:hypothetical protein
VEVLACTGGGFITAPMPASSHEEKLHGCSKSSACAGPWGLAAALARRGPCELACQGLFCPRAEVALMRVCTVNARLESWAWRWSPVTRCVVQANGPTSKEWKQVGWRATGKGFAAQCKWRAQ